MKKQALNLLRKALNNQNARFRDGQWESIERLMQGKKLLVVERTGWGKSMVYFLASRLMRTRGTGLTLLISPLLSLMRNQIEAAERIGVRARTMNSTNDDERDRIIMELENNEVDVLLISPERLATGWFREDVLSKISSQIGLFVVDEAHCISDWGHDFRPDYRRIVRVINSLPSNIPVLATTATANDRVVEDVINQLGSEIELIRGPLVRESLKLQNIYLPDSAARMAWLVKNVPDLPGSGIIYTLTKNDAEVVSQWLNKNGINTKAYHAGLKDACEKERLEQLLMKNKVKALVSTVALGMGFDKPDLGFVIHFQRPGSVVHYYQQVGRAGRALENAYGILLCGSEDEDITNYFIRKAFPPQEHIKDILEVLDSSDDGFSKTSLQSRLNLSYSEIEKTLKFLTIESPSPVAKIDSRWYSTPVAVSYRIDQEYVNKIIAIRKQEQQQMKEYMEHTGCLMEFLEEALDDPNPDKCNKCINCNPDLLLSEDYDALVMNRAKVFLKRNYQVIKPRKKWPSEGALEEYGFSGRIGEELAHKEGRALCMWNDDGWGQLVVKGKYETERFDDELVRACVDMVNNWKFDSPPKWVTFIPSHNRPKLVANFASRLAAALHIKYAPIIKKVKTNEPQKTMENSFQQARNLDGVFKVEVEEKDYSSCLLIDDMVDSGWTFTVVSALLRKKGCQAVYPLALALNSKRT